MADIFGRNQTPQQPREESINKSTSLFDENESLLAKSIIGLAEADKSIDLNKFGRMAILFENGCIVDNGYHNKDAYDLKSLYKDYSLSDWDKFLQFSCVQKFINTRERQRFAKLIDSLYNEIEKQSNYSEKGVNSQLVNSLNKAIEGLQKLIAVSNTGETFVTIYAPKKNYDSIISNKVLKTECMTIREDNTKVRDFEDALNDD